MNPLGEYQKNIEDLDLLPDGRYENIFKIFIKEGKYVYNILKTVHIDIDDLPSSHFEQTQTITESPFTYISYAAYNTQDLWWIIYLVNKDIIKNPIELVPGGTTLRLLKIDKVRDILDQVSIMLEPPAS